MLPEVLGCRLAKKSSEPSRGPGGAASKAGSPVHWTRAPRCRVAACLPPHRGAHQSHDLQELAASAAEPTDRGGGKPPDF